MPATYADRLNGVETSLAIKAPVRVATTANITLSGLQTIDGITLVANDRVLVKNQTTGSENGIYVAQSTSWERAKDFDGNRDVKKGTLVYVTSGTTITDAGLTGAFYQVTTADPITIGTTSITFAAADVFEASEFVDEAEDWATKIDGAVDGGTGFSSKAWAIGGTDVTDTASRGAAKEWAIETSSTVDGSGYSAKEWATGTQTRGAASGGSAKDWASYTGGTVDNAEYSAKYYAQQASATLAAGLYEAVQSKSADYTVVAADEGDLIQVDTSGASRTITLTAISTLGDFKIAVTKITGDGNIVTIQGSGGDTINGGASYSLDAQYEVVTLIAKSGQTNWLAVGGGASTSSFTAPDFFDGDGSTLVFSPLSRDPGSENAIEVFVGGVYQDQSKYSLSGTTLTFGAGNAPATGTSNIVVTYKGGVALDVGTVADSSITTAKLGDDAVTSAKLADQTGVTFTEGAAPSAPAAGAVVLYAKSDGFLYSKDDGGTETWLGLTAADQSAMEAGTSNVVASTPGRQKYNPAHTKECANFNGTGTAALRTDSGISSLTDHNTGEYSLNFDEAYSSTSYIPIGICDRAINSTQATEGIQAVTFGTTAFRFICASATPTATDQEYVGMAFWGDK
jgi:hypothetical protein